VPHNILTRFSLSLICDVGLKPGSLWGTGREKEMEMKTAPCHMTYGMKVQLSRLLRFVFYLLRASFGISVILPKTWTR
jgi:hypothetical protein